MHQIRCWPGLRLRLGWGAPPQTPLGELTALPRPLAGSKGPYLILRIERMGGEGKGRTPQEKNLATGLVAM